MPKGQKRLVERDQRFAGLALREAEWKERLRGRVFASVGVNAVHGYFHVYVVGNADVLHEYAFWSDDLVGD